MQGIHLRKYGVETIIDFELYETDGVDLKMDAADGGTDCNVSKDEGGQAVATNDFVDRGFTYSLTLTATEMQAARIVVMIIDSPTKVYLDKVFEIETYGHPLAQHPNLGLSGLVLVTTTIATLASQVSFTLTAGSTDNNAYVGCIAVIEDASTATQKAVGLVSAYTGATKTVTLAVDPGIFTMAAGDKIQILPVPKQLPAAPADAAGGLPISDAGGLDLDAKLANTNEVTAVRMGVLTDWINGGRLDLLLDAIKERSDNLPDDPADASVIAGLLSTIAGYLDTEIAAIKVKTDNLPGSPAAVGSEMNLADDAITAAKHDGSTAFPVSSAMSVAGGTIVKGTVSWDNTNATTTIFYSDDIIEATADHFNDRIVIFTSGALQYQATKITDYELVAGEGKFTVTALTEAPADNVTFVIL